MKKIFMFVTTVLLISSATFAQEGKQCAKGKACCNKKECSKKVAVSKDVKTTSASVKKA